MQGSTANKLTPEMRLRVEEAVRFYDAAGKSEFEIRKILTDKMGLTYTQARYSTLKALGRWEAPPFDRWEKGRRIRAAREAREK